MVLSLSTIFMQISSLQKVRLLKVLVLGLRRLLSLWLLFTHKELPNHLRGLPSPSIWHYPEVIRRTRYKRRISICMYGHFNNILLATVRFWIGSSNQCPLYGWRITMEKVGSKDIPITSQFNENGRALEWKIWSNIEMIFRKGSSEYSKSVHILCSVPLNNNTSFTISQRVLSLIACRDQEIFYSNIFPLSSEP